MGHISDGEVKDLKAKFVAQHGQFVLPLGYNGHTHVFQPVATGVQLCTLCGAEHVCFRGNCPDVPNDNGELVCTLTGCVTRMQNLCNERDVHQRTSLAVAPSRKQRMNPSRMLVGCVHQIQVENLYNNVHRVVHEMLDSDTTRRCMLEESQRGVVKIGVVLGRLLREMNGTLGANVRINLVNVETSLAFTFRRLRDRRAIAMARDKLPEIMKVCIQSIVSIINQHGWYRTNRQLTHIPRSREFICSMLYLMRTGVTYRHRCILPKMEVLLLLLPQQVFLQKNFNIRPKCITEGENIIKLDARKIHVE